jgi:hypothetical protein
MTDQAADSAEEDLERDFELWARLAARLRLASEAHRAAILEGQGLADRWTAIHEIWSRVLVEDIAAGRMERPNRYLELCRAATGSAADVIHVARQADAACGWSVEQWAALCVELAAAGGRADEPSGEERRADEPSGEERRADEPSGEERRADEPSGEERKRTEAVWNKHGITLPRARAYVESHWARRLARDPELRARWIDLCGGGMGGRR